MPALANTLPSVPLFVIPPKQKVKQSKQLKSSILLLEKTDMVQRNHGGIVFFTIRWWNPEPMSPRGRTAAWPEVEENAFLWTWLFAVPLAAYTMWQLLYFLIADALSWQQFLISDPEVITSYSNLDAFVDAQGTTKEGSKGRHLVEVKQPSRRQKSTHHEHFDPDYLYSSNHGSQCSHLPVLRDAFSFSGLDALSYSMEWWKLHLGYLPHSQASHPQGAEEKALIAGLQL
ncbi:hypothetical protein ZIOFF_047466 [Zingiber officinale]|uniref:Glycerophosphocholine acyltransferase 1 n=1 Tax=Zingiber officinale TaxID=94328 RepID=A0A8J5FPJ3_ZINOF|nr:hypothetical protein ZIOFF_047466 [Zingiber officinale]